MPSTYTTNLGIEKIATGEQSGVWGATTNTNLDLIDQAVNGIVSITLPAAGTSGSPNALNISDGSLSDGRNKFIEFVDSSDLGATAYVQLVPNDAEKIVIIRNSLSGNQSLIIFQGTYNASNDFEIANGKDVVLKFDGAGTGATVTQVFNDLSVAGITATTASFAGLNLGDNDKAQFGAGNDLQIYHDGSDSYIDDAGTGSLNIRGSRVDIGKYTGEIAIKALSDAEVELRYDNSAKLATTSTGIDVTGTVTADGLTVDTNTLHVDATNNRVGINTTTPSQALDVVGNVRLPASTTESRSIEIGAGRTDDGFTHIDLTGDATYTDYGLRLFRSGGANSGGGISSRGTGDLRITTVDAGDIEFNTSDTERMRIDSSGNVGIGTSSPTEALDVDGNVNVTGTIDATTVDLGNWTITESAGVLYFATGGVDKMKLDASGNLTVVGNVTAYGTV